MRFNMLDSPRYLFGRPIFFHFLLNIRSQFGKSGDPQPFIRLVLLLTIPVPFRFLRVIHSSDPPQFLADTAFRSLHDAGDFTYASFLLIPQVCDVPALFFDYLFCFFHALKYMRVRI